MNPSLPADGVDKLSYYEERFGAARVAAMIPQMKQVGAEDGIAFSYGGMVGNTLDSHRVIELAARHGKQDAVVERLFKAYFEDEQNIGNRAVLADAMRAAGVPLDASAVHAFLDSSEGVDAVEADARRWRNAGEVTGVPFFIINDEYKLSGAQQSSVLSDIFDEIGHRAAASSAV